MHDQFSYAALLADSAPDVTPTAGQYAAIGGIAFILTWPAISILGIYFFPTILAIFWGRPGRGAGRVFTVFLVNLFLGWTAFGWVIFLMLA